VLGFTDHVPDLEVDGVTYRAASGHTRTAIRGTADEDVPGAVASGVAAEAFSQAVPPDDPKCDGRHRRREYCPEHRHDDICRKHHRHCRRPGDRQSAGRQGGDADEEQAAFETCGIDERANWRMKRCRGVCSR
jgi:hypothetical protein